MIIGIYVKRYNNSSSYWLSYIAEILDDAKLASIADLTPGKSQSNNLEEFCQTLEDKDVITLEDGVYQVIREKEHGLIEWKKLSDIEVKELIPF